MAILQALFTLITKSAGTMLNAVFGWAVVALFGRTSPKEQTLLSGLVGMAAAWPLLLVGVAVPRLATFAITFVPLSKHIPALAIRIVWASLAIIVPIVVGLVVAAKRPPGGPREPFMVRVLRGFPITLGIATAFVLMFVTVPVLRCVSIVRGRQDEHVPSITEGDQYEVVAAQVDEVLRAYHLEAPRTQPSWWLSGPSRVLQKLCGKALRGFLPEKLAYWQGPTVEVAFYPSDILVRGKKETTAWIHGILVEQLTFGPGLQTFDPRAQKLERKIRALLSNKQRDGAQLKALTDELGACSGLAYDDWQVLYRQLVQAGRAVAGQPQLLAVRADSAIPNDSHAVEAEDNMDAERNGHESLATTSTAELLGQLVRETTALAKKEVALATAELHIDLNREIGAAKGFGVVALASLAALNLLLVAAVLALSQRMPGWLAALVVAGGIVAVGGVAGFVAWKMLVQKPLTKTRKTVEDDVAWAKQQIA